MGQSKQRYYKIRYDTITGVFFYTPEDKEEDARTTGHPLPEFGNVYSRMNFAWTL